MARGRGSQSPADRLRTRELFACLARAGRFRDDETADHVERMSRTCALLAEQLGFSRQACTDLLIASAMHDIGKIGVPDAVLLKRGPLNAEQRALIERHPEIGHEILAGSRDPVMQLAATIALTHHEQIDGRGYPTGLRGDEIPLPGRIAAVADVFDALTHERVYRPAMTTEDALAIVRQRRGTHFDAAVIDALECVLPRALEIQRRYPSTPGQLLGVRYHGGPSSIIDTGHWRPVGRDRSEPRTRAPASSGRSGKGPTR